jgi:hypothetical protein
MSFWDEVDWDEIDWQRAEIERESADELADYLSQQDAPDDAKHRQVR